MILYSPHGVLLLYHDSSFCLVLNWNPCQYHFFLSRHTLEPPYFLLEISRRSCRLQKGGGILQFAHICRFSLRVSLFVPPSSTLKLQSQPAFTCVGLIGFSYRHWILSKAQKGRVTRKLYQIETIRVSVLGHNYKPRVIFNLAPQKCMFCVPERQ